MGKKKNIPVNRWELNRDLAWDCLRNQGVQPYTRFEADELGWGMPNPEQVFSLYQIVIEYVGDHNRRNSHRQVDALQSIERAMGTYLAVHEDLERIIEPHDDTKTAREKREEESFINAYSLFAGAAAGLGTLKEDILNKENRQLDFDFTEEKSDIIYDLTEMAARAIAGRHVSEGKLDDEHLVQAFQGVYSFLINQIRHEKNRYDKIIDRYGLEGTQWTLSGKPWDLGDMTVRDWEYTTSGVGSDVDVKAVDWSEIVGNRELITGLRAISDNYFEFYVPGQGNPAMEVLKMPNTYLLKGRPGTGKTITISAFISELEEKAAEMGVPFEAITFGSNIKSKWYGEGEKFIREQFEKVHRGDGLYAIVVEDIDALLASREDMREDSPEKGLLQELLNQLEGITSSEHGNYILLATTNQPLDLDDALSSRLKQNQIEVTGPETAQDYADLLQIMLKRAISNNYVVKDETERKALTDEDWLDLGKLCFDEDHPEGSPNAYENSLTGRSIRNVSTDLYSEVGSSVLIPAEDKPRLKELSRTDKDAFKEALAGYITVPITLDQIRTSILDYHGSEKDEELAVYNQRKDSRLKEMKLNAQVEREFRESQVSESISILDDPATLDKIIEDAHNRKLELEEGSAQPFEPVAEPEEDVIEEATDEKRGLFGRKKTR